MDTREQDGTSDLFVWGIIQQPASESQFKDPFNLPTYIYTQALPIDGRSPGLNNCKKETNYKWHVLI